MAYQYTPPMTYMPNYFLQQPAPMQMQQQPQANQPSTSGLIWIQGESAAKSYLVAPNTTVLLMDSEAKRFYIKSADASGMPLPLRVFEYDEVVPQGQGKVVENNNYVTREEFERKIAELTEQKTTKKEVKNDEQSFI